MAIQELEEIVTRVVSGYLGQRPAGSEDKSSLQIPVGISNRHVHLCRRDIDILFGEGYEMQVQRDLSQKGYFAAKETLVIAGPKGAIARVRILGPLRAHTQVELLASDCPGLGIEVRYGNSGELAPGPQLTLIGPKGTVVNQEGIMIALRHIHMQTEHAKNLGLKDGDQISVKTHGERALVFSNVKIRTGEFNTELHLDMDEANACGVKNGTITTMII